MRRGAGAGWVCRLAVAAALGVSIVAALAARARASEEILLNGDLAHGSGNQPDNWRTEAWINDPADCSFHWKRPSAASPGELEVDNLKPNDARWMQSLTLGPGWYYFSAEIRTEDVGYKFTGATISVTEDGITSPDLKGTKEWRRFGFYLRVGAKGANIEVALRVGGFGSLNTGKAFFRNPSVVKVKSPGPGPHAFHPLYDLEQIRKQSAAAAAPKGSPISLIATFIALAVAAAWGWTTFATEPLTVARSEPPGIADFKPTRGRKRRPPSR